MQLVVHYITLIIIIKLTALASFWNEPAIADLVNERNI
jgi:hypothetical protein